MLSRFPVYRSINRVLNSRVIASVAWKSIRFSNIDHDLKLPRRVEFLRQFSSQKNRLAPSPEPESSRSLAPTRNDNSEVSVHDLLSSDCLAIQREIEVANILIGYEQCNQYTIRDRQGLILGYVAEEDGFGKSISRNLANTHRTFKADVLDSQGNLLLRITKPFHLIQSELIVENRHGIQIGEIKMNWHLYKRRYDLFLGTHQFGRVDGEFLAWEFSVKDEANNQIAVVDRNWLGLGRELIADAGRYVLYFGSGPESIVHRFDPNAESTPIISSSSNHDKAPFSSETDDRSSSSSKPLQSNTATSHAHTASPWYQSDSSNTSAEWWNRIAENDSKSKPSTNSSLSISGEVGKMNMLPSTHGGPTLSDPHATFFFQGKSLSLDQRAVVLGLAILIDFDYFSHKSGSGGLFPMVPFGVGSSYPSTPPIDSSSPSLPRTEILPASTSTDAPPVSEPFSHSSTTDFRDDSSSVDSLPSQKLNVSDPELMQDKWGQSSDHYDKESESTDSSSDSDSGSSLWDVVLGIFKD